MEQITIKLRFNTRTGKKDIVIEYESEADATGWEHEKRCIHGVEQDGAVDRLRPNQTR